MHVLAPSSLTNLSPKSMHCTFPDHPSDNKLPVSNKAKNSWDLNIHPVKLCQSNYVLHQPFPTFTQILHHLFPLHSVCHLLWCLPADLSLCFDRREEKNMNSREKTGQMVLATMLRKEREEGGESEEEEDREWWRWGWWWSDGRWRIWGWRW